MNKKTTTDIEHFFVAGISYKQADAVVRGMFAVNNPVYQQILEAASVKHIDSLFVLSTCNRIEIYGCAENAEQLIQLLCLYTQGDVLLLKELGYVRSGMQAIEHLFNVAAGLDSQILGDYEIVGQLKQAVKFAKDRSHINCFMERLINGALQASKTIKNETTLSDGTISVSFAAVQYLKENISITPDTKILMLGIGKIGRNTCKNMADYLGTKNITLINRSEDKAKTLAAELNMQYAPLSRLNDQIKYAEIILVATNACELTILASQLAGQGDKLIIDLSVPYNVELLAGSLPNVTLVNVDQISKIKDNTLRQREAEAPKAVAIVARHIANFTEWHAKRQNAAVFKTVKTQLNHLYIQHLSKPQPDNLIYPEACAEEIIQRTINNMAGKLRANNEKGCQSIAAINEFITSVGSPVSA